MINLFKLGIRLYNCDRWINYRCVMVFVIRSLLHYKKVQTLHNFFCNTPLRHEIVTMHPLFFAQLTRQFFYRGSCTSKRLTIITQNFLVWENQFTEQALQQIYLGPGLQLWSDNYKEQALTIDLAFRGSEIKEGAMSIGLKLDNKYIYHINFWIVFDENDTLSLYIGALQGSRNGLSINKELTKYFFGYRPQNLIVYTLRILAQILSVSGIKAVSNYGFYANNHLCRNRKLKTSLDKFWNETGGKVHDDPRFFEIPITEPRKNIEDVVSHKRNLYRKRYTLIDEIRKTIVQSLELYIVKTKTVST
ncbi:VirK/YbjX family protein [Pectinatus frisingensis]|uniref:VirK/YbjX family protein n=1 Tax=Pectinatus frisingensis TaxID=865 RepID=UPI001E3D9ED1|nr:DUF535 family protein [Pectinatus frisingensis]